MTFESHHPSGMGVVLADGSFRCYDCMSLSGYHRCSGSDGAWAGAPPCTCPGCAQATPEAPRPAKASGIQEGTQPKADGS